MVLGRHLTPLTLGSGLQLERSAYTLLSRLTVEGPMSLGELSDAFGLDVSTLNRQTAKMAKEGLVRRVPDPDGGVARKFEVTEGGAAKLASDRAIRLGGLQKVLGSWPAADVAELAGWLRRFNAAIEAYDDRPWPRPDGHRRSG